MLPQRLRPRAVMPSPVRRHVPVVLLVAAAMVLSVSPAVAADLHHGSPSATPLAAAVPGETVERTAARVELAAAPARRARPYGFATIGELELLTPSPRPVLVGFHEAAGHGPVAFTPVAGQVMDPRGRGTHATSSVDVAMEPGDPVLAVVTGTVAEVSPFTLYGQHQDLIVTIIPDVRPDLKVKILHIGDVQVAPGQHVTAGADVIAGTARALPVSSQIDRYAGRSVPHVHIEVVAA